MLLLEPIYSHKNIFIFFIITLKNIKSLYKEKLEIINKRMPIKKENLINMHNMYIKSWVLIQIKIEDHNQKK